mmetsp:Transcript_26611/g.40606  ORF Transcript_26611/g.40606 Transcript_26611/m.40606 type:complete len:276 (-) Transcript_26611:4358-5185(-)
MVDGVQPQDVLLVHVHGLVLRYIVNSLALLPFLAVLQDELDVEVYHHFGVEVGGDVAHVAVHQLDEVCVNHLQVRLHYLVVVGQPLEDVGSMQLLGRHEEEQITFIVFSRFCLLEEGVLAQASDLHTLDTVLGFDEFLTLLVILLGLLDVHGVVFVVSLDQPIDCQLVSGLHRPDNRAIQVHVDLLDAVAHFVLYNDHVLAAQSYQVVFVVEGENELVVGDPAHLRIGLQFYLRRNIQVVLQQTLVRKQEVRFLQLLQTLASNLVVLRSGHGTHN